MVYDVKYRLIVIIEHWLNALNWTKEFFRLQLFVEKIDCLKISLQAVVDRCWSNNRIRAEIIKNYFHKQIETKQLTHTDKFKEWRCTKPCIVYGQLQSGWQFCGSSHKRTCWSASYRSHSVYCTSLFLFFSFSSSCYFFFFVFLCFASGCFYTCSCKVENLFQFNRINSVSCMHYFIFQSREKE